MTMTRTKIPIQMTLDPSVVAQLDEWIASQEIPPHRNQVVELLVRKFLIEQGGAQRLPPLKKNKP